MRNLLTAMAHPRRYRWLKLRPFQRHSLVLIVGGFVYLAYGYSCIATEPVPNRLAALKALLLFMPLKSWGVIWCILGVLALISSRWPPASKTWGYTILSLPALVWSSGYLAGAVVLDAPASAYSGALIFGLLSFLWWAIAGLENPDDLMAQVSERLNEIRRNGES
jgi:hypothetical protein